MAGILTISSANLTVRECLLVFTAPNVLSLPYGKVSVTMIIRDASDFGMAIREARLAQGLRQTDLAVASGCGERFIIDLEKGKPTCELQKAMIVARMLGMSICSRRPNEI